MARNNQPRDHFIQSTYKVDCKADQGDATRCLAFDFLIILGDSGSFLRNAL